MVNGLFSKPFCFLITFFNDVGYCGESNAKVKHATEQGDVIIIQHGEGGARLMTTANPARDADIIVYLRQGNEDATTTICK